ncbi:hypothetical protein AVEN_135184-1 [Araneus ventricosus]|uniref:Tc1-like transposase DDE domain-containing protein n=1 Tax=Araneus ventricosus TaxID=182803 RepID=A0A4Y2JXV0_ARAVE|nr:hypothetical protein AVEN_135184-1 [Araneus ventricosus]
MIHRLSKHCVLRGIRPTTRVIHDKIHTFPKFKSPSRGSLDGRPVAALYKMAAMQEKSFCVLEYAKCSSVKSVLDSSTFIFQQDGAAPHWSTIVRDFLNRELPHRWIGRAGLDDVPLLPWPPRSPDLTPFLSAGLCKGQSLCTPNANNAAITAAVTEIDGNMLLNVWMELDYLWDVCRVTKGAHIEHL